MLLALSKIPHDDIFTVLGGGDFDTKIDGAMFVFARKTSPLRGVDVDHIDITPLFDDQGKPPCQLMIEEISGDDFPIDSVAKPIKRFIRVDVDITGSSWMPYSRSISKISITSSSSNPLH
jgi:hypothetical protein